MSTAAITPMLQRHATATPVDYVILPPFLRVIAMLHVYSIFHALRGDCFISHYVIFLPPRAPHVSFRHDILFLHMIRDSRFFFVQTCADAAASLMMFSSLFWL